MYKHTHTHTQHTHTYTQNGVEMVPVIVQKGEYEAHYDGAHVAAHLPRYMRGRRAQKH